MEEGIHMLVYYTRTNNVKKMLETKLNLDIPFCHIQDYDGVSKFVLITPTYGIGEIPKEVDEFLKNNHKNMLAVIGSGNKNWGLRFCNGAKLVSRDYKVPLLYKFELSGMKNEITDLRKVLSDFYGIYQT